MSLLEQIFSPLDLRRLDQSQIPRLCKEIREEIIRVVEQTGGHLASSLGVVELTVALHAVFQSPVDPIVWDVGNQAYAHKLLTGRRDRFHTIRQPDGLSGFTRRQESEHDCFGAGHASTSISAALGIAEGKRLKGEQGKVVAVIGDGGMTGGLAFEGLNHAGSLDKDLIVVLNDNGMFISPKVGAMSHWMSRRLSGERFNQLRRRIKGLLTGFPRYGEETLHVMRRVLESAKALFTPGILFEGLNFQYVGPVNGHDVFELMEVFENVKHLDGPVLVHVHTKKGKGLLCAEKNPSQYHGIGPGCLKDGLPVENKKSGPPSYTEVFSKTAVELAEKDDKIVAITAAMPDGTGLNLFAERFPDRFYDVGIAEGHAVTFAAGLACEGYKPIVAIYSSFLQRSYDMLMHDVCLQNLPVIFALDRAGIVGDDGPTHHGVFDLSYLRTLPNMTVMAPADENELVNMLHTARTLNGPVAIRYPRGAGVGVAIELSKDSLAFGKGRLILDPKKDLDVAIISIGTMLESALKAAKALSDKNVSVAVADMRYAKPVDENLIVQLGKKAKHVITLEENILAGGFGESVSSCLTANQISLPIRMIGIGDEFVPHGTPQGLRRSQGLDVSSIVKSALEMLKKSEAKKQTA
jgi:1-deoxy-D-xylulose-5-phosphate synthase